MPTARHRSAGGSAKGAGLRFTVSFEDATPQDQRRLLAELKLMLERHFLERMSVSVESAPAGATAAIAEAELRGEARLVRWTQDGTLVPVSVVEKHWGVKRQTVDAARRRREIFSLFVRGQHWYPAEALKFNRIALGEIVKALGEGGATSKLLFMLRRHGTLGNRTPAEGVDNGMLHDVIRVATAQSAD